MSAMPKMIEFTPFPPERQCHPFVIAQIQTINNYNVSMTVAKRKGKHCFWHDQTDGRDTVNLAPPKSSIKSVWVFPTFSHMNACSIHIAKYQERPGRLGFLWGR